MNGTDMVIIFLLMSRMPVFIYIIWKAVKLRNSMVLINSIWLGTVAIAGLMGAVMNSFGSRIIANLMGTVFSIALFFLAYTAKQLVRNK